mmetsp:Transcript_2947/g.5343  ORF Transcript_2947/g.5343 Transcript_2947/m.5343 type:complete len:279 (+) Transcript_2947:95-931(+)
MDPFSHQSENIELDLFGGRGHEQWMKEELRDREREFVDSFKNKYDAFKSGLVARVGKAKRRLQEVDEVSTTGNVELAQRMENELTQEMKEDMEAFYENPQHGGLAQLDDDDQEIMWQLAEMDLFDGGHTDTLLAMGGSAAFANAAMAHTAATDKLIVAVADLAMSKSEIDVGQVTEPMMKAASWVSHIVQGSRNKIAEFDLNGDPDEPATVEDYKEFLNTKIDEHTAEGQGPVLAVAQASAEFGVAVAADCFGAYLGPNGDVCAEGEDNLYYDGGGGD